MGAAVPDEWVWVLALSDAAGRPSMREIDRMDADQVAAALIVDEAVGENRRALAILDAARRAGRT